MDMNIKNFPLSREKLATLLIATANGTKSVYNVLASAVKGLIKEGYLTVEGGRAIMTEKGKELFNSCVTSTETQHDYVALATKMRELFPKGTKPETSHLWRSGVTATVKRLKELVAKTGAEFTDEEAIQATEAYVTRNKGSQYMRVLLYFIYKNDTEEGERKLKSDLLDWIDQIRDGELEEEPEETLFTEIV